VESKLNICLTVFTTRGAKTFSGTTLANKKGLKGASCSGEDADRENGSYSVSLEKKKGRK